MLPVNPRPPTRGREKVGNIIINDNINIINISIIILIILIIRGIMQNTQNRH